MRTPLIMLILALLLIPACSVAVRGRSPGHVTVYRHESSHHRHRHHRHWNAAGPAYAEAATLTELTILPVTLPVKFDGEFSAENEAVWRRDWPKLAAQLVADGLTTRTESVVTGAVGNSTPTSGHYMRIEITYIDVGDIRPNDDGSPRLRGSSLAAHGFIMNAATNQLVADVKFSEGAGWNGQIQFEVFMARVGSSLGDWFKERRKK